MSSPLNANATSSLLQNIGFNINPVAAGYMGSSVNNTSYTPGTTVTSTCLYNLTRSINLAYYLYLTGTITSTTYNDLISIGSSTIPALGNSKPPTYGITDPSGMWSGEATTGYAIDGAVGAAEQGQTATWIPYNTTNFNSSITQWGYLRLHALQAWYEFNYNGAVTTTSVTAGSFVVGDAYTITSLGTTNNNKWNDIAGTSGVIPPPTYKVGDVFIAHEVGSGTGTASRITVVNSSPIYQDFLASFMTADSSIKSSNTTINTFANGTSFLDGVYSNMNDLISGDVTGVTIATTAFGQDCITLGKVINLAQIQKFGLPSVLLQTLRKYNAVTQSLSLALLSTGLSVSTIDSIAKGSPATPQQEQQIYGAFLVITGQDLTNILVPLNCKTLGLTTLADLLNVSKIFPNSYRSLTVPLYNITPASTNSKTYYFIYDNTGVSSTIDTPSVKSQIGTLVIPGMPVIASTTSKAQTLPTGFSSYLSDILPYDIALAAGAFSFSMRQIKNIQSVDFEKFAQVVFNIETVKDLTLINGTTVPANTALMNQGINIMGLGSGPNKTYTMSDFFGCMSGLPYDWERLTNLILTLQTSTLSTIYTDMYNTIIAAGPGLDAAIQGYTAAANSEIALNIYNSNSALVQELNALYEQFGNQLMIEQRARYIALAPVPVPRDSRLNPYPSTNTIFASSISQYALNTLPHMEAQTIEAICNLNTTGGQSIDALMREARNGSRLQYIGVPTDNNISPIFDNEKELLCNGIVDYTINGTTYTTTPSTLNQTIGNVNYAPVSAGELLMPGSSIKNQNPYNINIQTNQIIQAPVYVSNNGIPLDTGQAMYPSSFAGSPVMNMLPINLNTTYASKTTLPASYSVPEAINQVIHCNCDCWLG